MSQGTGNSAAAIRMAPAAESSSKTATADEVEELVSSIVSHGVSITQIYSDWFRCGLALADTLGEGGREPFHRLSRMDSVYNEAECDKQYDECLKTARHDGKVHAATLFYMAQQAGVSIAATPDVQDDQNYRFSHYGTTATSDNGLGLLQTPTFSDKLDPDSLPYVLQAMTSSLGLGPATDMMTVGLLTALSTVMPNVCGTYHRREVWPPFYCFVVAPPASNKSMLTTLRKFLQPIEQEIRLANQAEMAEYEAAKARFDADRDKGDATPPQKPPYRSLYLPANSSATSVYQVLNENGGHGLIFETEGDTMAQSFKSDYGNYSDGLRAAFHHEPISYCRRKDNERVDIEHPTLSVLLSGTPNQVRTLIHDAENGLFSRFLFYLISMHSQFEDVFANDEETYDDIFLRLGCQYLPVYHWLKRHPKDGVRFRLAEEQQQAFLAFFRPLLEEQRDIHGDEVASSVMRLGLIFFRMAMALTVLRMAGPDAAALEGSQPLPAETLTCDQRDFDTVMIMANVLVNHTVQVYTTLLSHPRPTLDCSKQGINEQQRELLNSLPDEFASQQLVDAAASIGVPPSTARKWMSALVSKQHISRIRNGQYRKL